MASSQATLSVRDRALCNCRERIEWYEGAKKRARRADYALQTATIAFSAITPLLVLDGRVEPVLQALPATLAAIAAGLQGVFKFRERFLGYALARELLAAEKLSYEVRSEGVPPDDPRYSQLLEEFTGRTNQIVLDETRSWQQQMATRSEKPEPT